MTYQEANALVDDFSFVYKGKSIPKEALIECREVIHKALEKQIPRKLKVREEFDPSGQYKRFCCPYCNKWQYTKVDGKVVTGYVNIYCPNCG